MATSLPASAMVINSTEFLNAPAWLSRLPFVSVAYDWDLTLGQREWSQLSENEVAAWFANKRGYRALDLEEDSKVRQLMNIRYNGLSACWGHLKKYAALLRAAYSTKQPGDVQIAYGFPHASDYWLTDPERAEVQRIMDCVHQAAGIPAACDAVSFDWYRNDPSLWAAQDAGFKQNIYLARAWCKPIILWMSPLQQGGTPDQSGTIRLLPNAVWAADLQRAQSMLDVNRGDRILLWAPRGYADTTGAWVQYTFNPSWEWAQTVRKIFGIAA